MNILVQERWPDKPSQLRIDDESVAELLLGALSMKRPENQDDPSSNQSRRAMALLTLHILQNDFALALHSSLTVALSCSARQLVSLDALGGDLKLGAATVQQSLGATLSWSWGTSMATLIGVICAALIARAARFGLRCIGWSKQDAVGASMAKSGGSTIQEQALADELVAALALIRNHMIANRGYAQSLVESKLSLSQATKPEQIRLIVQLLISENERTLREAEKLESGLEQSRRQIEQLQTTLAVAEDIGARDALTSVANRRQFDKVLDRAVGAAHADQLALCLVMADIDHFKRINDRYGHLAGDRVLQDLGKLLTTNVKGRDTVARYGGEEFAIILPQTTIGDAYHVAEQIRSRVEATEWSVASDGSPRESITVSFGIAQLRDGDSPVTLFGRADANLYESKRLGRNRVTLDSSAKVFHPKELLSASLVQA